MSLKKQYLALIFWLTLIGVVFIYNSTVIHSQNVFGNPHKFFFLHLNWVLVGAVVFVASYKFGYKRFIKLSPILYSISLILLFILAVAGILPCSSDNAFTPCLNEANRWLNLNPPPLPQLPLLGTLGFQPAEFAKLALILLLAYKLPLLLKAKNSNRVFYGYFLYTLVMSGLVLLQPNMSTAVLIFVIGTAIYFSSGASIKPLLIVLPILAGLALSVILLSPYRRARLITYISGSQEQGVQERNYQVTQVKLALGSGGFFGVGFGRSRQKYTYLPEVASDSIFAVIGEEFGFIGTFAVILLFVILTIKGLQIANRVEDVSARLLVIGVTTWVSFQVIIHVGANSGLIPYTGVPLPLISYGGSSFIFLMAALGILTRVSDIIKE